ncbi:MAG: FtsX-like permease family protein [Phycisphaeraceae bacterium]
MKRLRSPWLWVFIGWTVVALVLGLLLGKRPAVNPITLQREFVADGFNVLAAVVGSWIALAIGVSIIGSLGALASGADRQMLVAKYLRRKLSPMFAALAVTLCTAMVIIVISVMGGFLQMWRDTAKRLTGDLTVSAGLAGFPRYELALEVIRNVPEVEAASAMIKTYGLVKLRTARTGNRQESIERAEIVGINPEELNNVVPYKDCLYWTRDRVDGQVKQYSRGPGDVPFRRVGVVDRLLSDVDMVDAAMQFKPPASWQSDLPGIAIGVAMSGTARDEKGNFVIYSAPALGDDVTVTVAPLTDNAGILDRAVGKFTIVNEVQSGFIEYDQARIWVPFEVLQKMLEMEPQRKVGPDNLPTGEMTEARASVILIRGRPGIDLNVLYDRVERALAGHPKLAEIGLHHRVKTWIEEHRMILGAVENEKSLLVFLFAIISLVALVMVATTFYNFVLEKTRDIGVLRAIGTSHLGVAGLFLGYGLVIGVVGAAAGLGLAYLIVDNLNGIQWYLENFTGATAFIALMAIVGLAIAVVIRHFTLPLPTADSPRWRNWLWLLCPLAMALIAFIILRASPEFAFDLRARFSIKIWDARIYYFETIPTDMNPREITFILAFAVLASVLGSLLPAIRAARLDPVEAIRYE